MSKRIKLPKYVTIGAYKVELVKIAHEIAYESSDYQGSFVSNPPLKIFLDEDIINSGGMDAVNLILHELCHVGFYQYGMKDKDEEHREPSYKDKISVFRVKEDGKAKSMKIMPMVIKRLGKSLLNQ